MNLSSEVIRDLLPAYVAGEASADTCALVEESLAAHPELKAEAEALGTIPEVIPAGDAPPPSRA